MRPTDSYLKYCGLSHSETTLALMSPRQRTKPPMGSALAKLSHCETTLEDEMKLKKIHDAYGRGMQAVWEVREERLNDLLINLKACSAALKDIINAANNGEPYSPNELADLFADIQCRADAAINEGE